jgi:peptidoglycan hydrolase-like protein with peptidoglycan-binding domain
MEDVMNSGPTLAIGSTGPDVRRVQILLVMIKLLDFSGIDSNFGPKTQHAVKSFQEGNNLTPDGVVGPVTWNALPADPNTQEVKRGSTGDVVSALQKGLKTFDGPNTPTLAKSMGALVRGRNQLCAPIKRRKRLQSMELLAIRRGGFLQAQPEPHWRS